MNRRGFSRLDARRSQFGLLTRRDDVDTAGRMDYFVFLDRANRAPANQ